MKFILFSLLLITVFFGCSNEPDIATTKKGIRYTEDKIGTGDAVKKGDLISLHFKAWVISDSTNLFGDWSKDSTKAAELVGDSKAGNAPAKFILDSMNFAPGIDDVIVGMKPGGIRTVILPPTNDPQNPMGSQPGYKLVIELAEFKTIQPVKMWDVDTTKIQTTASGLQYILIEEGQGDFPVKGNIVSVHFSGFLLNGSKFDSSVEKDQPIEFRLGDKQVIAGWEEGIALLKKGGKARLIVPDSLAFGEMSRPGIPANSILLFDVELVDIK
jgi:FKBP-type peptidyl-prolyl cis-trans isomerase